MNSPSESKIEAAENGDDDLDDDPDEDFEEEETPSEAAQTAQYCRALAHWTGSDEDRETLDEIAEILNCEEVIGGPPITIAEMLAEARAMLPKGKNPSHGAMEYLHSVFVEQLGPEWRTALHGVKLHVDVQGSDVAVLGIFPRRYPAKGFLQVEAPLRQGLDQALEEMMSKLAKSDPEWARLLREFREWRKG